MKTVLLGFAILALALSASYLFTGYRLGHFTPPLGAVPYQVAGTNIYAIDEGSGSRTVVLIHGAGGSIDDWSSLRKILRRQFRVVTVERPANGWSGPLPYEPDDYLVANASVLQGLLESLDVRDAAVVGWSYGGAVALRLAADSPHLVGGLVHLCAMGPGYNPWTSPLGPVLRLGRLVDLPVIGVIVDQAVRPGIVAILPKSLWLGTQYGPGWKALSERTKVRTISAMLRPKLATVREVVHVENDLFRLRPLLSQVEQSTLVISCELDPVVPAKIGAELMEMLPNARRVVVPGAGHAHHVVAPEEIATLIQEFVGASR